MNSVHDEREEKRWQGHKKFGEVEVAASASEKAIQRTQVIQMTQMTQTSLEVY
jgi:hypothetical protein